MADAGIVRNRAKIERGDRQRARGRARCARRRVAGRAAVVVRAGASGPAPRTPADVPAVTPESTALAKELKRRGFRFVGPTTAYALMQACGLVNDHLEGCAGAVTYSRLRRRAPDATARELLAEVRPRERAPADRPFVFVNIVATLDGRARSRGAHGRARRARPTSRCCSSCARSPTRC